MSNININISGLSIQVLDLATNTFKVNSVVPSISLGGTDVTFSSYFQVAGGAGTVVTLPNTTVWVVGVRNQATSANVTVQAQATGGALPTAANSLKLTPSGLWLYANPSEGAGGCIGLTLVSDAGPSPVELILGF